MSKQEAETVESFWQSVGTTRGTVTFAVLPEMLWVGAFSLCCLLLEYMHPFLGLEVGPVEIAGGALGLLLVLRTNAGYDRWWEARVLWGRIVNDARGLASMSIAYVRADANWQKRFVHWTAAFPHAARLSLRGEEDPCLQRLLGEQATAELQQAHHMPTRVTSELSAMLAQAQRSGQLDPAILNQMEACRQRLIAHIGACERVRSSPLPRAYVIKIRHFLAIYLCLVPFALVDKVGWATPFLSMLVAYPALGMDFLAQHLQMPFNPKSLTALPIDKLCSDIESHLLAQLREDALRR